MDVSTSRTLGLGAIVLGVLSLLVLRLWASPIALAVTGRRTVSVLAFLGIPLFLIFVGVGIALFVWGPELTAG